MRGLARGVTPLVDLMWQRALQSAVLGMDETPVMELGGPGRTLKGYLWTGVGDANHPYDCFFYTSDRRSIGPETRLTGFQGYLTADAYVAYERDRRALAGRDQDELLGARPPQVRSLPSSRGDGSNPHGTIVLPPAVRHRRPISSQQ